MKKIFFGTEQGLILSLKSLTKFVKIKNNSYFLNIFIVRSCLSIFFPLYSFYHAIFYLSEVLWIVDVGVVSSHNSLLEEALDTTQTNFMQNSRVHLQIVLIYCIPETPHAS